MENFMKREDKVDNYIVYIAEVVMYKEAEPHSK